MLKLLLHLFKVSNSLSLHKDKLYRKSSSCNTYAPHLPLNLRTTGLRISATKNHVNVHYISIDEYYFRHKGEPTFDLTLQYYFTELMDKNYHKK